MRHSYEPCLCGDPECPRCFPGNLYPEDYDETLADEEREERAKERHARIISNTCDSKSERDEREALLRWLRRGDV